MTLHQFAEGLDPVITPRLLRCNHIIELIRYLLLSNCHLLLLLLLLLFAVFIFICSNFYEVLKGNFRILEIQSTCALCVCKTERNILQ